MKTYNGEKAIISLTSWKARINTVSKTIYSLLKMCPGFHIVLCLSEEEFPKKEAELPDNLMVFVNNDLIEILWVYKNCKSFKKVLFAMDKYSDVPVISADDDCLYICNYAEILYNSWIKNKDCIITNGGNSFDNIYYCRGVNTLYPPRYSKDIQLDKFSEYVVLNSLINDDCFFGVYNIIKNRKIIDLKQQQFYRFHDDTMPMSSNGYNLDKEFGKYIEFFKKKMVISMDCISGHMNNDLNLMFDSPFMWNVITPDNMLLLINNWDSINFFNYTIEESDFLKESYKKYRLIIDNLVSIEYIHTKECESDKTVRKVKHTKWGGDTYYYDCKSLIKEQYERRLNRMLDKKYEPIFLINEQDGYGYTKAAVQKLLNEAKKPLILISSNSYKTNENSKVVKIDKSINNDFKSGRTVRLYLAVKKYILYTICN